MPEELPENRLKRLKMRSMRRGIKEMDIILGGFSETKLTGLNPVELDLYEVLLEENDHDLYQWVTGAVPTPETYLDLMTSIANNMVRS
ncbi:succinate dehydrogenase assembly factor 2 [Cochlodiniinecator piscidefendens]|uniref:succinate dehydrogenase assembly factor 2 n=1 Tax=Cochlodiniinecator piscidefendens TaxID=2715756 RepID=UPI00140B674E|nr:succinate dehydrogenase assembly factor 2 [Cochlodiniinecator piscidefendens]